MNNSITTFLSIFTPMVVNRMVSCILSVTILLTFTVIPSPVYGQWAKYYIDNNLDYVYDLFVADMDGDDTLDVVAAGYNADDVVWYEGPLWNKHYIDSNLNGAVGVFVADMDGDDTLDVVAAGEDADDVVWYEAPLWTKHYIDSNLDDACRVYVADMDSDNDLDVVAAGWLADSVVWYEAPLWSKHVIDDSLDDPFGLFVADMDGDDTLDVVAAGLEADDVVWYEAPLWNKHYIDSDLDGVFGVYVADIDSDDDLDVVAVGARADKVVWYEAPLWTQHVIDDSLDGAHGIYVADIDGDDMLDVVAAGQFADEVDWYEAPLWTKHVIDSDLDGAVAVYVADMDSDNDLDVVAVGWEADDVVLYDNLIKQVYAKSVQCYPRFIPPQGDTLIINAQLHNPENHPVEVYALIQGDQIAFKDSLQLFDDGQHSDSAASDNIWGNSKWLSGLPEDICTIGISTYDLVENYPYDLLPIPKFTTIGPVVFDHFEFISNDTIPNPGDQILIRIFLRNDGSDATALNITAKLTSLDPGVATPAIIPYVGYGDIGSGEISASVLNYRIGFIGPFDKSIYEVPFALDIRMDDYSYWIVGDTTFSMMVGIEKQKEKPIPKDFSLYQNYPNPFNPSATIEFDLPKMSNVTLKVFDILGEEVATLVSERLSAGSYAYEWDASKYASGVYLYRLQTDDYVETRKMVLLR